MLNKWRKNRAMCNAAWAVHNALRCLRVALMLLMLLSPAIAQSYVVQHARGGDFKLNGATLYVDKNDYKGVRMALTNLQQDLQKVTTQKSTLVSASNSLGEYTVIAGSIDRNRLLQQLLKNGKLNADKLTGLWEGFQISVIDEPFDGVKQALVIAGSDQRGAIFGIYDLAEQAGVSPWYWWADVPVKRAKTLSVPHDTQIMQKPAVRYRGIFLNDEAPALTGWVNEKFGNYNSQFYQRVFELLLRLKANYLWPAMWNNAFNRDDPNNRVMARDMGIVMGTSHHEPMARAHKEWTWADASKKGNQQWNYRSNRDAINQFWRAGIEADKDYESIVTLGMRGDGDEPMSEREDISLLEKIIADQRQILNSVYHQDITQVEQVWTLYKEVQGYYERGMRVPDDVTLLWSDDNWGNIRRLPTARERGRSGGAGVYYHFDYVGGPRSYRWINTIPIAKIWQQMNLAYRYGANRIWIANVGDLKPMELPIDFFLTMAWNPQSIDQNRLSDFSLNWAAQQFGDEFKKPIAKLINAYVRHNGRRKPELLNADTYSQLNYQEAERIVNELKALAVQANTLSKQLPHELQDAYFQLVLYPVKATANLTELYDNVAKNRLYAQQGRASANRYADKARANFESDQHWVQRYHAIGQGLSRTGRWNHMMSQPHIGYTHWNNPPTNTMPTLYVNQPPAVADMGVTVEGTNAWWPSVNALALGEFSPYGQQRRYIEIYNRGTKAFAFTATPNVDWIELSTRRGQVSDTERLWVSIDWSKAPQGRSQAVIKITGTGWDGAYIKLSAFKPTRKPTRGFIEADGYISIDPASANVMNNRSSHYWATIPGYGRTGGVMAAFTPPEQSLNSLLSAPYLEYPLHLFSNGLMELKLSVAPTLDFVPGRGLRIALGFDGEKPEVVELLQDSSTAAWQQSVMDGVRKVIYPHQFDKPGVHTLRVYLVDPGVVLEKIVLDCGGLRESYLGPPESQQF